MEECLRRRERILQKGALAGDATAWRGLFDSAYDQVHAYLRWRLGGRTEDLDDLAQEAWLVASRRLQSFDPDAGSFTAWVCGIAANVVRRHLRSRARLIRRVESFPESDLPALVVAEDDTADRVADALAALPDRYEQVLRAKYLEQLSVDAIAQSWRETPKAIESLLTRARNAFRQAFDPTTSS